MVHGNKRGGEKNKRVKDRIKSLSGKDSVENIKKNIDEIETINIELEHTLKNELKKIKGKIFIDTAVSKPAVTIALGMFKLNLELLAPKLLQNKDVHMDYIKHSMDMLTFFGKYNAPVKHSVSNAMFESLCAICNKCLFDANHAMCLIEHVNDVNVHNKAKSIRNKKRKEWKPMGKVFTKIGYSWKPTGKTFTIVGNRCPLNRITSTKIVPPKESSIALVVQIVLWYLDSGCSKHMTGNRSRLINFVSKFLEGLGHNLFSVGQFCDLDLEVAFRKHTCFIRDLEGVDLLKGSRGSNLYMLSLEILLLFSPICLLSQVPQDQSRSVMASRCISSHFELLFAKQGLVRGLPNLKYLKDHLCSACAIGKSKKHSHKPKAEDSIQEKLYLLHMDLCGPMRVQSINGRKYILVIVDDFSQFTWVKFLRSKDEVPEFVIKFLKMIQVCLNATVRNARTDNGTEFVNQTLRAYYEEFRISHLTSVARTPQ
ncbi:retrovirus-related pol polyprotein from transposon TNT 1-94 [Tanacetum coccineum]